MNLQLTRLDVWETEINDKPGGLSLALQRVADNGADIDFVLAHREPTESGKGTLLVAPFRGAEADRATQIGFQRSGEILVLKIEGPNEAGMGARIAKAIADTGVNMNSLTATALGHRFVCFVGFDTAADRQKAAEALESLSTPQWRLWPRHHAPKIVDLETGHTTPR